MTEVFPAGAQSVEAVDNHPRLICKGSNPTSDEEAAGERSGREYPEGLFWIRWIRAPALCKAQRMSAEKSLSVQIARPIALGPSVRDGRFSSVPLSEPLTRWQMMGGLACWSAAPLGKGRARPVYRG